MKMMAARHGEGDHDDDVEGGGRGEGVDQGETARLVMAGERVASSSDTGNANTSKKSLSWMGTFSLGLCNAVDAVETTAFGSVLTSYVDPYTKKRLDEDPHLSGMLTSGVFIGMLLGGLVAGTAADVYGRKPVLLASMIINGLSAVLSSICPWFPWGREVYWLLGFRILAGMGVGGSVPCAFSLMAEWSPDHSRGLNVSLLNGSWSAGMIFTAFSAWILLSPEDNTSTWPIFLFVCSLPAFVAFVLTRKHIAEAPNIGSSIAVRSIEELEERNTRSSFVVLALFAVIWFCQSFGSYGVSTWIGDVFHELGYKDPFAIAFAFAVASVPGTILASALVDRIGRRALLGGGMTIGGLFALGFSSAQRSGEFVVILCTCLFSVFTTMAWVGLGVVSAESFPFESRTTRMGIAAAFGRIGSIAANAINPFLLREHAILSVAGMVLISGGACAWFFVQDRTGLRLDERS